jgi:hypothetical protein
MLQKNFYQRSLPVVLTVVLTNVVGLSSTFAAAGQSSDDVASMACNFFFRLKGEASLAPSVTSLDASTDCDSYHIYLHNHPTDRSQSTFWISETGTSGSMTYHVADMPLDVVVLLLTPGKQPTRVLARRQSDRLNFIVGRKPFEQPPPTALLPRSSSRAEGAPPRVPHSTGASPARATALLGSWRTQGAILELHADGTFAKVSNSAWGVFGGVGGVDDNGTFEVRDNQIVFRGMIRERTCAYSLTPQNELMLCDVRYHRE